MPDNNYGDIIAQLQAQGLLPTPEVGQLNQVQPLDVPTPNIPAVEPIQPGKDLGLVALPPTVASPGPTPLVNPDGIPLTPSTSNSLNPEQSAGQSGSTLAGRTGATPNANQPVNNVIPQPQAGTTPINKQSKFGDLEGANNAEEKALQAEGTSAKVQAIDQYNATKAKQDAVNLAQANYVDQLNANEVQYQKERALAHASAAAETAAWMRDMDQKAAEEPQPNRWWTSTTSFGKALWMLSLAFGAKAAQTPGVKNIALEMMQHTIDDDMAIQKDKLKNQREAIKEKGSRMVEMQKQTLEDQRDDYTHQVGRINALLAANTVKANSTTDADLKAQLAAVDTELNIRKVQWAAKRADQATQERLKTVEEAHADRRQATTEEFGLKKQSLEQQWRTIEEEKDRQLKRDLAEESASAKLAAAEAKAQHKADNFEFAGSEGQSGVNVQSVDKSGKPVTYNLSVPKERAKDAQEIVQNSQAKLVALSTLRDEIKKNGIPYGAFSNDVSGVQALKAVADPQIRQMSGRFNKDTVKEVQEYIVGEDPTSLINRLKGGSADDIVKTLDREIAEATGATKQRLSAIPGINIADDPNAKIIFTAPDTRGPGSHEQTPDEKIEAATGKAPPTVKLTTPKDIKQFGDEAKDALPSSLRSIIDNAQTSLEEGHTKDNVLNIRQKAAKAIDEWKAGHAGGDVSASNATKLLDSYKDEANKIADKLPSIVDELSHPINEYKDITKDEVVSKLNRAGLTSISSKEIQDIVNQVNATRLGSNYRPVSSKD